MTAQNWQLTKALDAVVFDCDGTLSLIEGIDELARKNGQGPAVAAMTADAMGQSGINPGLYKNRLDLVKPTRDQIIGLGMDYYSNRVHDVPEVIACLLSLKKTIYIVSAGLFLAVDIFGKLLQIPSANIFAVNIEFDDQGHYLDFDHHSPLVTVDGKRLILTQLVAKHPNLAFIGDGLNDYTAHDLVARFIGFGGAYYRQNIKDLCQYYISTPSMSAALPLLLTASEAQGLPAMAQALYQQGLQAMDNGQVKVA